MPEENQPTTEDTDPLNIGEVLTIPEAARVSGFSHTFLRGLAAKGKLRAKKVGNTWLTTLAAIEEYKISRSLKNIPKKYRDRS